MTVGSSSQVAIELGTRTSAPAVKGRRTECGQLRSLADLIDPSLKGPVQSESCQIADECVSTLCPMLQARDGGTANPRYNVARMYCIQGSRAACDRLNFY